MKLTKTKLKQIIKEELGAQLGGGEGADLVEQGKERIKAEVIEVLRRSQGYFGREMMAEYLRDLAMLALDDDPMGPGLV
jgi:hypothetical protein